jgi:hypothetical protein
MHDTTQGGTTRLQAHAGDLSRDDKIIDPVAVSLAVRGGRRIPRLTRRECAEAVRQLLSSGTSAADISEHLKVPLTTISAIITEMRSAVA